MDVEHSRFHGRIVLALATVSLHTAHGAISRKGNRPGRRRGATRRAGALGPNGVDAHGLSVGQAPTQVCRGARAAATGSVAGGHLRTATRPGRRIAAAAHTRTRVAEARGVLVLHWVLRGACHIGAAVRDDAGLRRVGEHSGSHASASPTRLSGVRELTDCRGDLEACRFGRATRWTAASLGRRGEGNGSGRRGWHGDARARNSNRSRLDRAAADVHAPPCVFDRAASARGSAGACSAPRVDDSGSEIQLRAISRGARGARPVCGFQYAGRRPTAGDRGHAVAARLAAARAAACDAAYAAAAGGAAARAASAAATVATRPGSARAAAARGAAGGGARTAADARVGSALQVVQVRAERAGAQPQPNHDSCDNERSHRSVQHTTTAAMVSAVVDRRTVH